MFARGKVARSCTDATLRVLRELERGSSQEAVAADLKLNPSTVSRHVSKLQGAQLLSVDVRSSRKLFIITPQGKTALRRVEVASSSYPTTTETQGVHDLYIELPIIKRPAARPAGLWEHVNDRLNNNEQAHMDMPGIGAHVRETTKHVCIQVRPRELETYNDFHGIVASAIGYVLGQLTPHGYVLDFLHPKVSGLELTFENEQTRDMVRQGIKIKVALGRDRAKVFPGDPSQAAWVKFDRTPGDNKETNDLLHHKLSVLQPELVAENVRLSSEILSIIRSRLPP